MYRILIAAAVAASAALASGAAQAGTTDGTSLPLTQVAYYGDGGNGMNNGDNGWRRWHRWHSTDRGWGRRDRPAYGSFHGNRCRVSIVTHERDGRMVTVRRKVCF